MSWEEFWDG